MAPASAKTIAIALRTEMRLSQDKDGQHCHIDRVEIVHRRDFGDGDAGHGVEPADHAQRMNQPAQARKLSGCAA